MGAFIEQGITEARMVIDDMIKESLELCQNNSPTAIEGRGGTPMATAAINANSEHKHI